MLIVMPVSGKVTFWESVSAAATMDVNRQRAQCVEGKISLMSGEAVASVAEGEPLGFALACSSGRVAHLTIGDTSSKMPIFVDFLQTPSAPSGGYFGSFSSLFLGSGRRRQVAAIRSGNSSQRGQRQVVIATTSCSFEVWDFHWNKTQSMMYQVDEKEDILKALAEGGDTFYGQDNRDLHVLDFTFPPASSASKNLVRTDDKSACEILVLTLLERDGVAKYNLVGLTLSDGNAEIRVVHPVSCYTSPVSSEISFSPKILVPEPGHTAFLVFQKSIVLVSLAEVPLSADLQLIAEANALEPPFQDALDFHRDKSYTVVGCTGELADKHHEKATCVFAVHGYGIVRMTALPLKTGQNAADRARVTAKTKLEQAIFYGSMDQNLFDFSGRPEITFEVDEVDEAARDISLAICRSSSQYLPQVTPSTEHQLQQRGEALAALIKNLRKHYPPLSPATRMTLLQNAERMASAKAMFKTYSAELSRSSGTQTLLPEAVEMLNQKYKKENQPDQGETDKVRHWLIHDVWRFERLTPWLAEAVHVLQEEAIEDETPFSSETKVRLYSEACEETLAIIETAFQFREDNLLLYGFDKEKQVDGVLLPGYDVEIPSFWTSTNLEKLKQLADEALALAQEEFNRASAESSEAESPKDLATDDDIRRLIDLLPRMVQICIQAWQERLHMFESKKEYIGDAEKVIKKTSEDFFRVQMNLLTRLPNLGIGIKGVQLAEKYQNMPALVDIINSEKDEQNQILLQPGAPEEEKEFALDCLDILDGKIKDYFVSFGKGFADAFFDQQMSDGQIGKTLLTYSAWRKHLTDYLRQNFKRYQKIAWMNEILAENGYYNAGIVLSKVQAKEESFWNRKVQTSIAKLSLLAALETEQVAPAKVSITIAELDTVAATLKYQVYLQDYIRLYTRGAIDPAAAKDLAHSAFGTKNVKNKPMLSLRLDGILHGLVDRKILDHFELIDALTLIDIPTFDGMHSLNDADEYPMPESRFFLALLVAHASNLDTASLNITEIIVWRRCMIADNWPALNRTETKSDDQVSEAMCGTALYQTLYLGFRDGFWERKARPLSPDIVMADGGSISLGHLREAERFEDVHDDILKEMSKELKTEDKELRKMEEKGRLGIWFKGCEDAARDAARQKRDEDLRRGQEEEKEEETEVGQLTRVSVDMHIDGEGDVVMG